MKIRKITNPERTKLIFFLKRKSKENRAKIWRDVANGLIKPKRKRIAVNISHLKKHTEKNEVVVVPGKILGMGKIDHPITVAAFAFSKNAEEKIRIAKGQCVTFFDLIKKNPEGSNVKIIG